VLTLHGAGLAFRERTDADLPVMSEFFDETSIDVWTPLGTPFDLDAARDHLDSAQASRASGEVLHRAITRDGVTPLGEVLLFGAEPRIGELAYAVGVHRRGQRLAARAVSVVKADGSAALGLQEFQLNVSPQNPASQRVAEACGFELADEPSFVRERKGRRVELVLWKGRVG
jgi:RimJ/RimL family protein N-acetyltransferase